MLVRVSEAIERSATADAIGSWLERVASPLRRLGAGRDVLSGRGLGHPAHPFLVTAPIGAWTAASVLDLFGGDARTARRLVGAGVLMAIPTALTGASDWLDTEGAERRIGASHASLNALATAAYVASWCVRPRHGRLGAGLGVAGAVLASSAGWLGGHLAYSLGVGVDTNAFQSGPGEWTDSGIDPPVEGAALATVDGVRLAVARLDGAIAVVGDRCSHRGGPLSEGGVIAGCFECPWHGSRFDARSGSVRRGPASVPQPTYEVRQVGDRTEVRRQERRTLRTNPV